MPLSPVDFQAYSAATGAPYPETPDEKAAAYPAVAAWKAQRLAAQQEDRGPSATSLLLGAAGLAGLGLGGYALAKHLMDRGVRPEAAAVAAASATPPAPPPAPPVTVSPDGVARVTGRNPTTGTRGPSSVRVSRSTQPPWFPMTAEKEGTRLYPDIANFSPEDRERDRAGGLASLMAENKPKSPLTGAAYDGIAAAALNPSRTAQQAAVDALPLELRQRAANVLGLANNGARVSQGRAFPDNPAPGQFFKLLPTRSGEGPGDPEGRRAGTYQFVTLRNGTSQWVGVEGNDIARSLAANPVEAYGGVTEQDIKNGRGEAPRGSRHVGRWRSNPENFGDSVLLDPATGQPLRVNGQIVEYRPDLPGWRQQEGIQAWSDIGEEDPHLQKDYVNTAFEASPGRGMEDYFESLPFSRSRPFVEQPSGRGAYGYELVQPSVVFPGFDPNKSIADMLSAEDMASVRTGTPAAVGATVVGPDGPQRVTIPASPGAFWQELPPPSGDEGYYGTTAPEVANRGAAAFHNYTNTDRDVTPIIGPDGQPLLKRGPSGEDVPMTRGPSVIQRPSDLAEARTSGAFAAAGRLLDFLTDLRDRGAPASKQVARQVAVDLARTHSTSPDDVFRAVGVVLQQRRRQADGAPSPEPTPLDRSRLAGWQNPRPQAASYIGQKDNDPLTRLFDAAGGTRRDANFDLYPKLLSDDPNVRAQAAASWMPELGRSVRSLQGKVGLKALPVDEQANIVATALTMAARDYKTAIDVAAQTPGMEAIAAQAGPGQQNAITFDQFARPYVRRAAMGMVLQQTNGGPTSPARYTVPRDVAELIAHDAALAGRDLHHELMAATAEASSPFEAVLRLDDRVSAAVGGGDENYTAGSRLAEWFLKDGYRAAPDSQAAQLHQAMAAQSEGGGFRFPVALNFANDLDDARLDRPTAAEAEEVIAARLQDPTRSQLPSGDVPWKQPTYGHFETMVGNPDRRTHPVNKALRNAYDEQGARIARQNALFTAAKNAALPEEQLKAIEAQTLAVRQDANRRSEEILARQRQLDARAIEKEIEINRLNTTATLPRSVVDPATGRTVDKIVPLGSGWVLDSNGSGGVGILPSLLFRGHSLDEEGARPGLEHDGVIALDRQQDLALERGASPVQASADAGFDPLAPVLDAADTDQARARAEKFVADKIKEDVDYATPYRATSIPLKSYGRMTIDQATPLAEQLAQAQRDNIKLKRQRADRDLALFERFGDGPVRWQPTVPEQDITFRRHPANPVPGVGLSIARNQWKFNPETGQQEVIGIAQNPVDRGPVWSTADTRGMGGIARTYPNTNWSGDLPTPGADYSASFGPRSSANEYAGIHGFTLEDDGRRVMQPPPDRATEWVTTRLARPTQAQSVLVGPGPVVGTVERTDDGHRLQARMVGSNASDPIRAITGPEAAGLYYDLAPREDVPSGTSDFRRPTPITTGAPSSFDRDVTIPTGLPADQIAARAAFDAARQRGDTWQEGTLRGGPGDLSGEIGGGLGRRGSSMPAPERGFTGLPGSARPARTLTPEESARLWAQRHLRRR